MRKKADDSSVDKIEAMKKNYKKLRLDALVILGGNGTHKTANLLHEEGLHIVTMPKTLITISGAPIDLRLPERG